MPALTWDHGRDKEPARLRLQQKLKSHGYDGYVTWQGDAFRGSVGPFGTHLHASGEITDRQVLFEKVGGAFADKAPAETKAFLQRVYPA